MTAPVLTPDNEQIVIDELFRSEPPAIGPQPEQRIVFCGIAWDRYLSFDKKLGHDRPGPRLYYLNGELEIMTTSYDHERIKKWLGGFVEIYFETVGLEIFTCGQATMRRALKEAGAEPDESWCIGEKKEFPDLLLEIALTSGGVNKLELYRRFSDPEVWIWRRDKLEIFILNEAGSYERRAKSGLLPNLDISLLQRCVAMDSWQQARRAFRAGLTT